MMPKNSNVAVEYDSRSKTKTLNADERFSQILIQYRKCVSFVPIENDSSTCYCGRSSEEHSDTRNGKERTAKKWSKNHNTVQKLSRCHGQSPINGAWFVRLDIDTEPDKIQRLFTNVWQIPTPRLIISIIGGAKYFQMADQLESNFFRGMIQAALSSDAWILTNGYNVGVAKLVGQMISNVRLSKQKKLVAIGVCKWGCVKDRDYFTRSKGERMKENSEDRRKGEQDLDKNHSHYLMVDDGTLFRYDLHDFRTKLCVHLRKNLRSDKIFIPTVTMVVEGGKGTIKSIYDDLCQRIPVLIIAGSGRMADFFKRWLQITHAFDEYSSDYEPVEKNILTEMLSDTDNKDYDEDRHDSDERRDKQRYSCYMQFNVKKILETFKDFESQLKEELGLILDNENTNSESKKPKQRKATAPLKKESQTDNARKYTKEVEESYELMIYCLQPAVRVNLNVFELNRSERLSDKIFLSICKARHHEIKIKQQLEKEEYSMIQRERPGGVATKLGKADVGKEKREFEIESSQLLKSAMEWDCIEAAKKYLFRNSIKNILNQREAFLEALEKNLPAFVYEFLRLEFKPEDVFFSQEANEGGPYSYFFETLYKNIENQGDCYLFEYLDNASSKNQAISNMEGMNHVLESLIGREMNHLYSQKRFYLLGNAVSTRVRGESMSADPELKGSNSNTNEKKGWTDEMKHDIIMRDLFIWAVLRNRIKIAKVFLFHMKYRMCAALFARKVLNEYLKTEKRLDRRTELTKHAEYFENYAMECLRLCDAENEDETDEIVLQKIDMFGEVTCLQMAVMADAKKFISEAGCTKAVDETWFDKVCVIKSENPGQSLGYFISLLSLGFLAPGLTKFREDQNDKGEPWLSSHGITYSDRYSTNRPNFIRGGPEFVNNYLNKFLNFHKALVTRFYYDWAFYLFFAMLYSYVLLFQFKPRIDGRTTIDWTEILLYVFAFCMFIEEVYMVFDQDSKNMIGKIKNYFHDYFRIMLGFQFILFAVGFILRFSNDQNEVNFSAARAVMAINVEWFWVCGLKYIVVFRLLGPYLFVIGRMLRDLLSFLVILALVIIGYGVASRSMVYYPEGGRFESQSTDVSFEARPIFRQVIYPIYYMLYGDAIDERTLLDQNSDSSWSIVTHILLAGHMLFVNILLINLLIAMFSKRYETAHAEAFEIWNYQRYLLARQQFSRPILIPPLSTFICVYRMIETIFFLCKKKCFGSGGNALRHFKIIPLKEDVVTRWAKSERAWTYDYARTEAESTLKQTTEVSVGTDPESVISSKPNEDVILAYREDIQQIKESLKRIMEEQMRSQKHSFKETTANSEVNIKNFR